MSAAVRHWLNLVMGKPRAPVKASPAAEALVECRRRGVRLDPAPDGSIKMFADNRQQIEAVKPMIEEYVNALYCALVVFRDAQPPATLAELH